MNFYIDILDECIGNVYISGWVFDKCNAIKEISLVTPNGEEFLLKSYGLDSPDVLKHLGMDFGVNIGKCRFAEYINDIPFLNKMIGVPLILRCYSVGNFYKDVHINKTLQLKVFYSNEESFYPTTTRQY